MELLQKLVQIESISGQEGKLAGFILDFCRKNKVAARLQDGNVVVYLKGKDSSKGLIFNAHMDTVLAGELNSWKYPPYGSSSGKTVGDKLYGLGASDDKGAIAAMLMLAARYAKNTPPIDLWFAFVTREETDGSGTADFLKWFTRSKYSKLYKYIAVIIGEPTNLDEFEIGHRGNAFVKLIIKGVTGHGAGSYDENKLAVAQMLVGLEKLKQVFKLWENTYTDSILGKPTMNITSLSTGSGVLKKVPKTCEAILDIRTTPKLHRQLMKHLKAILGSNITIQELHQPQPAGVTSKNSKIIKKMAKLFPDLTSGISLGSTDLFQFTGRGIDAIVLGPGDKNAIHRENEYVELSKVKECVKIYRKIIENF